MQQAIDAFFHLDECPVVRQVADRTRDRGVDRVFLGDVVPRIGLRLLHAERDFLLVLVNAKHDDVDFVANLDQLRRMIHPLGPGHFGNVDEPFDAVFELHESTVGHHVDDLALDLVADRVLGFDTVPWARRELFQAQRDLFPLTIDVEDFDFDLVLDLNHVRRMTDPAPAHVGDVEQTVDAAQVNERTEVGDILDDALAGIPLDQVGKQRFLGNRSFVFDELPA